MKRLLTIIAILAASWSFAAPAVADTVTVAPSGVTIASDSIFDTDEDEDTANYTISTKIPKVFTRSLSIDGDDTPAGRFFSRLISIAFGLTGASIAVFVLLFLVLPIILLVLVVWLILRGRRNARAADMRSTSPAATAAAAQVPPPPAATGEPAPVVPPRGRQQSYVHRRDNAIRNICVGTGLVAVSWVLDVSIGIAAGIIVLCIGVSDYIIYVSHRRDER